MSIIQQCILLSISRSGFYYVGKNELSGDRKTLVDAIDELYTEQPYLGTRKMMHELRRINARVKKNKYICWKESNKELL